MGRPSLHPRARALAAALAQPCPLAQFALLAALVLLAACGGAAGPPTLTFSAIPDADKSELAEGYPKVAAYLERELGVPVAFRPVTDYTAAVEAFRNGDIQLAWFGGVTGVQARRAVPGARAIAQGRVDPEFRSYFVAHVGTGVAPGEDFPTALAGRTFLFGPRTSTSGRVMPEHFLREATGRSPEDFFGRPNRYSSGHPDTARSVESGAVEAGVLSYKEYETMVAEGRLDPARCVRVWTTPPYPDYNWTAHPGLDATFGAGFVDRLQRALVALRDPDLLAVLRRKEGLIPATNADFEPVARTMAAIGM